MEKIIIIIGITTKARKRNSMDFLHSIVELRLAQYFNTIQLLLQLKMEIII